MQRNLYEKWDENLVLKFNIKPFFLIYVNAEEAKIVMSKAVVKQLSQSRDEPSKKQK